MCTKTQIHDRDILNHTGEMASSSMQWKKKYKLVVVVGVW